MSEFPFQKIHQGELTEIYFEFLLLKAFRKELLSDLAQVEFEKSQPKDLDFSSKLFVKTITPKISHSLLIDFSNAYSRHYLITLRVLKSVNFENFKYIAPNDYNVQTL